MRAWEVGRVWKRPLPSAPLPKVGRGELRTRVGEAPLDARAPGGAATGAALLTALSQAEIMATAELEVALRLLCA